MRPGARLAAAAALTLGLAGCAAAPPPPPPASAAACFADLTARGVAFERLDGHGSGDCTVEAPLRMTGGGVAWGRPGVVSCGFAGRLAEFEAAVVQGLARQIFGQPVRRLHHMGTYACRNRNNAVAGRLSEHALGRAIDIQSFELADGTVIDVRQHWARAGKKSDFLRTVARSACGFFSVVLTPDHDYAHRDHLHLDLGPHQLCGIKG